MIFGLVFVFLLVSVITIEANHHHVHMIGKYNLLNSITIKTTKSNDLDFVKDGWLVQPLDHFDSSNTNKWNMKYVYNDQFYKKGGPIFIYVADGAEDVEIYIQNGHIVDIAHDLGAQLVAPDNRFFGESRPTSDLSVKNLRFLKINQTLADLAELIKHIKINEFRDAKVILFGTNYGATLATWFSQQYPNLVNGVWASSAALNTELEFTDYFIDIGNTVNNILNNKLCANRIKRAFDQMDEIIKTGNSSKLDKLFNLYEPIVVNDPNEIATFYSSLANFFAYYIEHGDIAYAKFACNLISNPLIEDDIEAFALIVRNLFGDNPIHLNFKESMKIYGDDSWNSYGTIMGGRQIYYRTCTEIATMKTSTEKQLFGNHFSLDVFITACKTLFGNTITKETIEDASTYTNLIYGGFSPNVKNIIFTNGQLDPFRLQGITDDVNAAIIIPSVGKTFDFNTITERDAPALKAAKEQIRKKITEWVS